jgi:hypothetical protein
MCLYLVLCPPKHVIYAWPTDGPPEAIASSHTPSFVNQRHDYPNCSQYFAGLYSIVKVGRESLPVVISHSLKI